MRLPDEFEQVQMEEIASAVREAGYLRWSLAGDLNYGAAWIRRAAKTYEAEDPGETSVARANMRACAKRLERLAKLLPVVAHVG